jgi:hypothetical protein
VARSTSSAVCGVNMRIRCRSPRNCRCTTWALGPTQGKRNDYGLPIGYGRSPALGQVAQVTPEPV